MKRCWNGLRYYKPTLTTPLSKVGHPCCCFSLISLPPFSNQAQMKHVIAVIAHKVAKYPYILINGYESPCADAIDPVIIVAMPKIINIIHNAIHCFLFIVYHFLTLSLLLSSVLKFAFRIIYILTLYLFRDLHIGYHLSMVLLTCILPCLLISMFSYHHIASLSEHDT
nr:hypothetical protein GZ26D8_34 [uncultured archaeon GZfos26D8]